MNVYIPIVAAILFLGGLGFWLGGAKAPEQPITELATQTEGQGGAVDAHVEVKPQQAEKKQAAAAPARTSESAVPAGSSVSSEPGPTSLSTLDPPNPAGNQISNGAGFQSNCTSNVSPVFTSHITDMSKANYIVPPPTMGAGPSLKPHGYIGTDGARVPIYAPAAMSVKAGSYFTGGPYLLEFAVSCEVTIRFGHVTEPIEALKKLLPSAPAEDSRTQELSGVSFDAGDLVGYTTGTTAAGNWDFGVYNSTVSNRYANDPQWNTSAVYTTAVCPFEYFSPELKAAYVAKFNSAALGGNPPHGESFCR